MISMAIGQEWSASCWENLMVTKALNTTKSCFYSVQQRKVFPSQSQKSQKHSHSCSDPYQHPQQPTTPDLPRRHHVFTQNISWSADVSSCHPNNGWSWEAKGLHVHLETDGNCGIRNKKQLPSSRRVWVWKDALQNMVIPVPRDPRESSWPQQLQLLLSLKNQH